MKKIYKINIFPQSALAGESNVHNYEDMKKIYNERTKGEEGFQLEHELTKQEYEDYLEQYADLEERIKRLEDQKIILEQLIDQTMNKIINAEDETTRVELDRELDTIISRYGQLITGYE